MRNWETCRSPICADRRVWRRQPAADGAVQTIPERTCAASGGYNDPGHRSGRSGADPRFLADSCDDVLGRIVGLQHFTDRIKVFDLIFRRERGQWESGKFHWLIFTVYDAGRELSILMDSIASSSVCRGACAPAHSVPMRGGRHRSMPH